MTDPSWEKSIKLAQANMRAPVIKRFYELVSVGEAPDGFSVLLDGRSARTPGKAKLVTPNRALAELLAGEWAGQGEIIDPMTMPMTRLANSAIDGVARMLDATRDEIAGFAGSDLLCYRASDPERLVEMQREAFDPVLAWAEAELGVRFTITSGVVHVAQPPATLAAARAAIFSYDSPFAVTALHGLTSLSGSALIALAVARGATGAQDAWRIAHVDEDFQITLWGEDEEAALRRAAALARVRSREPHPRGPVGAVADRAGSAWRKLARQSASGGARPRFPNCARPGRLVNAVAFVPVEMRHHHFASGIVPPVRPAAEHRQSVRGAGAAVQTHMGVARRTLRVAHPALVDFHECEPGEIGRSRRRAADRDDPRQSGEVAAFPHFFRRQWSKRHASQSPLVNEPFRMIADSRGQNRVETG